MLPGKFIHTTILYYIIDEETLYNPQKKKKKKKKEPRADWDSDHELLIAKLLKLKKVEKTTRLFR